MPYIAVKQIEYRPNVFKSQQTTMKPMSHNLLYRNASEKGDVEDCQAGWKYVLLLQFTL